MSGRGRPPLSVQPVVVSLKLILHPGEDDDLIAFFEQLPPRFRATAVKAALRSGGMREPVENEGEDDPGGEDLILDGLLF